jgi:hypothetical protein
MYFFPNSPVQEFYNRFWVISPMLVISVIITYIRPLYKWLQLIYIILNIVNGLCVFYVGYTVSPSIQGYEYYYTWVMLIVIGLFTFYRIPLIHSPAFVLFRFWHL